jgi:eukaryotic-like serine/threonine-protein kinase
MTRCQRCQRRLPPNNECAVHGRPSVLASAVDSELPDPVAPPGYTLGRLMAVGGSAIVYSLTSSTGAPAILKWARWRDRDMHARFTREAEILRELGAPLTPTLIKHDTVDDWPYLLMEDIPGETLAQWMSRAGERGALGEIVSILLRIARTLQALHSRGYIHCDLKPENLVVGGNDMRLLDFGLAAREGHASTTPGAVVGTVHYLAPEQLQIGAPLDRRADIYAFGVIAFELFAGQPPFVGERRAIEYQHQIVRPSRLRDLRQLPAELDDFVLRCLAKHPDARPQTADALIAELASASAYIQTLKGVVSTPKKMLGVRDTVVLAWIEGGDPITIARAINDVHGMVLRSRSGAVLAAFAAQFHEAPVAVAIATCRELAHGRCRIAIHVTSALVRRSAHGKPAFYGPEIEQPASWVPPTLFTGMVLTSAAAELAPGLVTPANDLAGYFRDAKRDRTDTTDVNSEVRLVGRDRLLQDIGAIAGAGGMLIGIFGSEGAGKSRTLGALCERLRASKREVLAIRGRRRLLGDRPDDDRLLDALGGADDLAQALADAAARRVIVVIDDAHWFSAAARQQLLRDDIATSRVIASRNPMFEVAPGMTKRVAIELPPLPFSDSEQLLRDLLQPAQLIPDVLLQRVSVRACGNPGLLVALAREIKHRGGIRRQAGSDDWYVAADEIDTLLAAPSAAWLAARGLEGLAVDVAPIVRMAAALGPKFSADELGAVCEQSTVMHRLDGLVRDGVLAEKNGWFEFVDASLQDAIYDHALDERTLVHARALRYWLGNRSRDVVGWLARIAYHANGSGDAATAAACSSILAREARRRGELELASELEQRALHALMSAAPSAIAEAMRAFEDS